jgi:hypothetical protein
MNSATVSLIVFACVIGGTLIGLLLGVVLPPDHLSGDSKDVMKVGMGLVGTMTAILLGLLIASAKSFYDTQNNELTEMSAKVILLDRVLAHYGPEAKEARDVLRVAVTRLLDAMWSCGGRENAQVASTPGGAYSRSSTLRILLAKAIACSAVGQYLSLKTTSYTMGSPREVFFL